MRCYATLVLDNIWHSKLALKIEVQVSSKTVIRTFLMSCIQAGVLNKQTLHSC
jgi:hypothetical protein